jgi:CubicO group peptidase (beta-lactamase class C family)
MNQLRVAIVLAAIVAVGSARAAEPKDARSEPFGWQTVSPESQGMSSEKLGAIWDDLAQRQTTALLVVRNDRIVFERYAADWNAAKPHGTASLAKALVGGLSLAVAMTDGKIALDDPAAKFIPQWKDDPRKRPILIRHLGSHTSGLEDAEADDLPHEALTGWKGDFWKRLNPPHDPFTIARDLSPILFEPGAEMQYSNPGIGMLTYAVTASLKGSPQADVRSLLRDRIMRPIGVLDSEWSVGYGKTFMVDGLPLIASWGGASFTPRAVVSIGRLLMREGDWEGKRLLSQAAVRETTGDAGLPGNCGMGWFTNSHGRYPYMPRDAFWGAGAGDQVLLVIPSLKLIVVRNGQTLQPPVALVAGENKFLPENRLGRGGRSPFVPDHLSMVPAPQTGTVPGGSGENKPDVFALYHDPRARILFQPMIDAVADSSAQATDPYPPSPVISGIRWAPAKSIVRRAQDSDNWPLTWGDDDLLYTAYGDGTGFDPKVPEKLSLGFARIEGGPDDPKGTNIRSATGEQKGNGARGRKASGLLMVDGVLYMWVRNAGNSQLAWSDDHGKTWTWSDWKFTTGFGFPTFLNFGKNYEHARDEYAYIYSTDAESAYLPADRLVLARVRKDRIKDRAAYEFFAGMASTTLPTWTKDIRHCGTVFQHPGKCFRCMVSFDIGLNRYLMCQAGSARPVEAGFGVFDAPEPWGPWTTVTYTPRWDVSPGETASFPTKWMSADGKTLYLVFSGDDSFNVRQAVLTTSK